jgi:hypothetical protein
MILGLVGGIAAVLMKDKLFPVPLVIESIQGLESRQVNERQATITGRLNRGPATVLLNGRVIRSADDGSFSATIDLEEGANELSFSVQGSELPPQQAKIVRDTIPPSDQLDSPGIQGSANRADRTDGVSGTGRRCRTGRAARQRPARQPER